MWRKNMHGGREGGGGVYSSLFLFFFCRTALPQLGLFPEREEVEEGGAWKIPFPLFQSCTLPSACVFACDVAMASGVCVCVFMHKHWYLSVTESMRFKIYLRIETVPLHLFMMFKILYCFTKGKCNGAEFTLWGSGGLMRSWSWENPLATHLKKNQVTSTQSYMGNFQLKDRMISTFIPPLKFTIGDWLKLQEVNKMFPRDDEDGEIWLRDNG